VVLVEKDRHWDVEFLVEEDPHPITDLQMGEEGVLLDLVDVVDAAVLEHFVISLIMHFHH
jgi:hypothetical protein